MRLPFKKSRPFPKAVPTKDEERDTILTLLAHAIAHKLWQGADARPVWGHNICAVLADPSGAPVFWSRNASTGLRDLTQHAEVRLIQGYLSLIDETDLNKHTVYSTLEPCVMCVGMMSMVNVRRAVFGQRDPLYGGVAQRMGFDASRIRNGPPPYPKVTPVVPASHRTLAALDGAFEGSEAKETIFWLPTPEAEAIHGQLRNAFLRMEVLHRENGPVLDQARAFYDEVPVTFDPFRAVPGAALRRKKQWLGDEDYKACHQEFRRASDQREVILGWLTARECFGHSAGRTAMHVLGIGCGDGAIDLDLIDHLGQSEGGFRYDALDPNDASLAEFRARLSPDKEELVSLRNVKFEEFETTERYDVVHLIHALYHFPDRGTVIERSLALLKPGGAVLIVNSTDGGLPGLKRAVYENVRMPSESQTFPQAELLGILEALPGVRFETEILESWIDVSECFKQSDVGKRILSFFFLCPFDGLEEDQRQVILETLWDHSEERDGRRILPHPLQALKLRLGP